jgi:hypothetical protein
MIVSKSIAINVIVCVFELNGNTSVFSRSDLAGRDMFAPIDSMLTGASYAGMQELSLHRSLIVVESLPRYDCCVIIVPQGRVMHALSRVSMSCFQRLLTYTIECDVSVL